MYSRRVRRFAHAIALGVLLVVAGRPIAALACDWACGSPAPTASAHAGHQHHHHSTQTNHPAAVAPINNASAMVALSPGCEDLSTAPVVLASSVASVVPAALVANRYEAPASPAIPVACVATGHSPPATHLNPLRI